MLLSTFVATQNAMPDGSVSSPGLFFQNEITTGFWRPSGGGLNISVLGAQVASFTSTGSKVGEIYSDTATGYIGFGVAPQFFLDINKEYLDTAPGQQSIFFHMYGRTNANLLTSLGITTGMYAHLDGGTSVDNTVTVAGIYPVYGNGTWGVPGTLTSMRGVLGRARVQNNPDNVFFTGTGTIVEATGGYFAAGNDTTGGGTVINAYGVQGIVLNHNGGVISTARGLYALIENDTTGAGITTAYGLYIDAISTGPGIGSMFGIYSALPANSGWYNLFINGAAPVFFGCNVGIGSAASNLSATSLRISKAITGGITAQALLNDGIIQSGVTSTATYFGTNAQTAAASFTNAVLQHYSASQGTFGSGSSVSIQFGFIAQSTLIGASNNYGFYGNLGAGSGGRYNFYANGDAPNHFEGITTFGSIITTAGHVGIGATASNLTNASLRVSAGLDGGASAQGVYSDGVVQSDVISVASYFATNASTIAASFTNAVLQHYSANQSTIGAGSSVTTQFGFIAQATLIGASNNYGFYGNIPSGSGRFNFYAAGTAANYFNGATTFGSTLCTAGHIGIGTDASNLTNASLRVSAILDGGTSSQGIYSDGIIQSGVTSTASYFITNAKTAAASFILGALAHINLNQDILGVGSSITTQYGVLINSSLIGATNNYAVYADLPSGSGNVNFYAHGTARNIFQGAVIFGSYLEGVEITPPAGPGADGWQLFAKDNGSGKTQLMVQFATGVAQQIAIQP